MLLTLSSCIKLPPVEDCQIETAAQLLHCAKEGKSRELLESDPETDKMVCRSLEDYQARENYRHEIEKQLVECQASKPN